MKQDCLACTCPETSRGTTEIGICTAPGNTRPVVFQDGYCLALNACTGEYPGADKWGNPEHSVRGKYLNSVDSTRQPNREAIYALVVAHPQFATLKRMVDRADRALFGSEAEGRIAKQTPEDYIRDIVPNAKSSAQKNRDRIQLGILRDLGIPLDKPHLFRGHHIDWHKVAVDRAVIQGKFVPSEVLDCFYPA